MPHVRYFTMKTTRNLTALQTKVLKMKRWRRVGNQMAARIAQISPLCSLLRIARRARAPTIIFRLTHQELHRVWRCLTSLTGSRSTAMMILATILRKNSLVYNLVTNTTTKQSLTWRNQKGQSLKECLSSKMIDRYSSDSKNSRVVANFWLTLDS